LRFHGTIHTDDVDITTLKKRFDRRTRCTTKFTMDHEATSYITNLFRRNLQKKNFW
ncbi:hypothetical protein BCV72DRAFT_207891, partial [Rhizopus microsporus var. microsporus]